MGRVLAPYGIKGWIRVQPFTASAGALLDYGQWWLSSQDSLEAWKEFSVVSARIHASALVAQLSGIADREGAAKWQGAWLGVPRKALPPAAEGEVYWADLAGLTVVNRDGETLGRVAGLLDTQAHPVLRVVKCGEAGERLIPLVPAYVDAIDLQKGRIVVDWQPDY